MIIELKDTTAAAVNGALLKARRNLGTTSGLVFTMIVVADASHYADVLQACEVAGREHASRIIIVTKGRARSSQLSAEIRTGDELPGDLITLRMSGDLYDHADSVVLPLLLPDLPVVAWWPHHSPEHPAEDPLGALATRRITDAAGETDPVKGLVRRAENHVAGDTDLTWTRLTTWRAMLAAALDQYPARILSATVEADRGNAPAELMAAWLASRLDVEVNVVSSEGPGLTAVTLDTPAGEIAVQRTDGYRASYSIPGQPTRVVALKRRSLNELITEELRRMDADDIFEAATAELLRRRSAGKKTKK